MKNNTLKVSFFMAAALLAIGSYAQQTPGIPKKFGKAVSGEIVKCATTEYEALLQKQDPKRATTEQFEQWLAPKVQQTKLQRLAGRGTNNVVTIPVVFHIIHNGDPIGQNENIADEQVQSQITVLNEDFRRMFGTNGYNTNPVGADMEIEFCLAQQDENGIFTTGIERYNLGNEFGFDMLQVEEIKAQTQWDPEKYLNIWVFYDIFGLAGYAQFPTASGLEGLDGGSPTTANTDGVALGYLYTGSQEIYPEGSYDTTRNLGRTATHEVGHFFGLRHIWGDGNGNCSGNDYCDDTPNANFANQGCPVGADSCIDSEGPDMIENYMDYTNDACLNIFTQDQKDRMQAVLANSPRRVSLITSPGCTPGTTYDNDGSLQIQGAQSTGESCNTAFTPGVMLTNRGNNTLTTAVISYQIDDEAAATYNWNGSLAFGESDFIEFPSTELASGDHTINVHIVTVNGVADQASANDTKEQEFTISGTYNTTQVVIKIMADDFGDEIIWLFGDENADEPLATNMNPNNIYLSDFPESNQLFTTTVDIENSGCYVFAMIDLNGDGICCEYGNGYYSVELPDGTVIAQGGQYTTTDFRFFALDTTLGVKDVQALNGISLYPNPSNNVITIAVPNAAAQPESYTIYNSLGQVMGNGKMPGTNTTLDVSGYSNGVYFIKVEKGSESKTLQFIKY